MHGKNNSIVCGTLSCPSVLSCVQEMCARLSSSAKVRGRTVYVAVAVSIVGVLCGEREHVKEWAGGEIIYAYLGSDSPGMM